jgi:hypothetical protein
MSNLLVAQSHSPLSGDAQPFYCIYGHAKARGFRDVRHFNRTKKELASKNKTGTLAFLVAAIAG